MAGQFALARQWPAEPVRSGATRRAQQRRQLPPTVQTEGLAWLDVSSEREWTATAKLARTAQKAV